MKSGSTVDVYRLLHRTTLRAITEGGVFFFSPLVCYLYLIKYLAVIGYDTTFDKEYTSTYEDLLYVHNSFILTCLLVIVSD